MDDEDDEIEATTAPRKNLSHSPKNPDYGDGCPFPREDDEEVLRRLAEVMGEARARERMALNGRLRRIWIDEGIAARLTKRIRKKVKVVQRSAEAWKEVAKGNAKPV